MDTRSDLFKFSASMAKDFWTRGSLSSEYMEPDTSSRNTKLAAGRREKSISLAFKPIIRRRLSGFQGHSPYSVVTEKGSFPSGSG